jgi:uncharacterized protein (TIGR03086 family)
MEKVTAAAVQATPGVNERDPAGSTLYNTQLYLGPDGALAKHRKLMPTGGERLVWGMGDGSTRPATPPGRTCSGRWSTPAGRCPSNRTRRPAGRRPTTPPRPVRGPTTEERTMPPDQAELHRRAVEEFGARVQAVGDDQWELPSPCSDWNVRQLVNHLVYENRWTVPLMGGSTIAEVGDRYEGDLLGDHPKAAWEESSQEAVGSVQADGALDRIVDLSSGPTPAREYVSQLFADHLIHAWDLARAIGADERLDPELVDACASWFASMEDLYRSIGAIGERPEVRPGADPQTTLLAAFGRTA